MRFSDLNEKKNRQEKPKTAPVKPAPAPASEPVPAPPEPVPEEAKPVPSQAAVPAPEVPALPQPPEAPAAVPVPKVRSRREQYRADAASARKSRRPFKEMDAEARELYARTMEVAGGLLGHIDRSYVEQYEKISRLASLTGHSLAENHALLAYTTFATGGNYLQAHSANVMLISQAMGIALRLDDEELAFLGFCAMAHDIGMTDCLDTANSSEKFGDEEFARITLHSSAGAEKVDRIIDIDYKFKSRAISVISQVHERMDGSGYPGRLSGDAIDLFARIIGTADVYEAMSHPRSWREAYHPHTAVKYLIDNEGKVFDGRAIKALMEAMTLYPPGSLVALSTGEIARVVMAGKGSLTKPTVETLLDAAYGPVAPRLVDLMEFPLTAIDRLVELDEISRKSPKFGAKLELARWWVEW